MTFTFKLSRRLARLRVLPLLCAALLTASCEAGPNEPSDSAPIPDGTPDLAISPDSAALNVDGEVQFAMQQISSSVESSSLKQGWYKKRTGALDVSPAAAALVTGATSTFTASRQVFGTVRLVTTIVRWSATGGTIDSLGRYRAGRVPGKFAVVATMDGVTDTAAVTITGGSATIVRMVLSPASVSVAAGGSQQFSAVGEAGDGSVVPVAATFAASGGSITPDGKYVAPGAAGTYAVIASDPVTGLADTSTVTVTPSAPSVASVVLSPSGSSLAQGATLQYSAVGKAADGTTLAITPSYSATGGTISSSGLYTAGTTAGTFRVIASTSSPVLADTAVVTIAPAAPTLKSIILTPANASLNAGATVAFSASGKLSDGTDTPVTVTFSATGGSITTNGQYTAGSTGGSYRVIAKVAGGTLADTAGVTITAPTPPPPPPPPPSGSLLFDESFTGFSKWSDVEGCDPGTCPWVRSIVSSPVREGSAAARMEVRRDDPVGSCLNCSKRTEIGRPRLSNWTRDANGPFKYGDETWFGFSVYIPADWINDAPYTPGGGEILFQLHEQPDNNNWSKNRTSFLRLIAEGGNFRWITYASACTAADSCWTAVPQMGGVTDGQMDYIGPLAKGQWTDWVIHAKWSYGSDGLLEIYRDGVKVATKTGPNNYNTQQPGFFKLGLYKWSWSNTAIPGRVAGYDNVKICAGNCGLAAVSP